MDANVAIDAGRYEKPAEKPAEEKAAGEKPARPEAKP
jgi:hypothetical protein